MQDQPKKEIPKDDEVVSEYVQLNTRYKDYKTLLALAKEITGKASLPYLICYILHVILEEVDDEYKTAKVDAFIKNMLGE